MTREAPDIEASLQLCKDMESPSVVIPVSGIEKYFPSPRLPNYPEIPCYNLGELKAWTQEKGWAVTFATTGTITNKKMVSAIRFSPLLEKDLTLSTTLKPADDQTNNEKNWSQKITDFWLTHWQWTIMFIITAISCVFAFPAFYQFIKQPTTTEPQKEQREKKTNEPKINNAHNQSPSLASQRVDKWRQEIQSFSSGGTFYKDRFLKSNTYFEIQPYLPKNMIKRLSDPSIHLITGPNQTQVDTDILINLNVELDRIAAQ